MRTLPLAALAALALATAGAGSASAATISAAPDPDASNETLARYVAAPGELNDVTVTAPDEDTVVVRDAGALIAAGDGCTPVDAHTARCASPDPGRFLDFVALQLGDGDDRAETQGELGAGLRADGGPGDDTLIGSLGKGDELDGGGGHDTLRGRGNRDELTDGDDPDAPDADVLDGGGGNDTVSYAGRTAPVVVDLGSPRRDGQEGERDRLVAINSVVGGSGDDRLSGSGGHNQLEGMRGEDRIEGRGGADSLHGGGGRDVVLGRLGSDTITGGSSRDRLLGGHGDDLVRLKTGGDDVDCGRAFDTAFDARADDFLEPGCDRVGFGHFQASAYPVEHHPASVDFDLGCVRRNLEPLRGSMRIRESGGRRRTLAKRNIDRSARPCRLHPKRGLTVRLDLTPLGRRLASRHQGVHSTVSLRGRSFRNVDWTIELHH